ncbi:restriction endonuclease subunit S [Clostridium saccharoperbutylacetonicum]|uniref:restriction endonuclease subunit S n=1 Tax=Clostridium saccharoperbutylacetonicum TaxID=36745 RepID=UPI0039EB23D2
MAKKNLTLEEAIVKDVPYEVPENWVIVKLNSIFSFEKGKKPRTLIEEYVDNCIPYVNISYFESKVAQQYTFTTDTNRVCNEDDILIVWDGARAGLIGTGVSGAIGSTLCKIKSNGLNNKFVYYYFVSNYDNINLNTKGTGIPHVNPNYLESLSIGIPPFKEQQRIVNRIDSLFGKLDKVKELIEEAREGFEKRKQSIIESLLKGEFLLGIKLKEIELGSILNFKNGLSKRSGKEGTNIKVLRLADIEADSIFSENSREMLLTEKERENYKVENGDLVLIRVNGTKSNVGKAIQYNGNEVCAYCDHLIRIDSEGYNKDYIKFLINSDKVRKQVNELIVSSAGQNTISQSSLNIIKANIIDDFKVQEEIVNGINNFVFKEKKIEELTQLEEQIELIKKSILAKAFRGELGTNSEDDESALELLKEILSKE